MADRKNDSLEEILRKLDEAEREFNKKMEQSDLEAIIREADSHHHA